MTVTARPLGLPLLFEADREPAVTDDRATLGATLYSRWLFGDREWVCRDAAEGAALWVELAASADAQPTSAVLTALSGLGDTITGLLEQTGASAFARRAIGVGTSAAVPTRGDADARYAAAAHHHDAAYQALDATLTALAGLDSVAGVVEQTGADAFAKRAIGAAASTDLLTRAAGDARFLPLADGLAFAGVIRTTSSIAVTAADGYHLIILDGGTPAPTLPAAVDVPEGWWVRFKNRSGGTVTVSRSGSDTVNAGGTGANIANNGSLIFVRRDDAGAWETT